MSEREPDLVIERMPDWNWGAFLNENVASCIAIGATAQEALNNGMRELLKRAQQKGEKMPTFEPTVKEIIAEMYKRFGHLLGAREIDEFAHDFGRSPAASEERPFGQWTTFEQWWTDAGCKFNDPEIMAVQAFEEGQRQALQSVPSSPLPAIKLATYLLAKLPSHWQYDEVRTMAKEVVTDEPSDAEQSRCTTCWALLPCKVHQPQPRTCQEEQD